ncbi:hypothetical protein [Serratia marcescens]|uniref:hypothetical protein n=1 Tax=Serratia marcescens TaxID=615 RepID=UPI001320CA96|nr:hypothetical protein [Serratia marcescens]MXS93263.1 hypothetical protein [Serratia marcescens]QHJ26805.1 hypothetical protein GV243_13785 [Serratia marcescens]
MSNIADLIKNVQAHVTEQKRILEQEAASEVTKSTKAQDELEALIASSGEFLAAVEAAEDTKGRKVKSRGIAMCHVAQGGPANGRADSLLMKSKETDVSKSKLRRVEISKRGITVLTPEQEANLKGVIMSLTKNKEAE